jgi:AbrB family looped-hinge helix DNA binding protein
MGRFEATMTSKGQITVPSRLRSALHLKPGDKIVFVEEAGSYRIEPQVGTLADLRGVVRGSRDAVTTEQVTAWIEEGRGARWSRSTSADDE